MKNTRILLLSMLSLFLVFSACTKDDDATINESEVLATYLESTNSPLMKDFVNTDMPTIMPASEVKTLNETGQVYIIDIRSATDFATGHIANAHNVALGDILTHMDALDLTPYTKVAIVCYTGQTAGFAASLLRIMGYDKVYSMKWGMSSWNADFAGKWNTAVSNGNAYATQFTSDVTEKGPIGDLPVLSTGKTTGQEILEARMNTVLLDGFANITSTVVFENPSNYYIVNYWPANHYTDPGHIPGAIQYTPKETIKLAADLKTLPTDKTIVVYCYTGQTSAFLTAYLRLLGYDAKSLLYGANGMIYDKMVAGGLTIFSDAQIMGYDCE
ncbi:MAG: rhodanese-like domain-containing protein [Bacteroidales bacterium]|nr:rhodanese-like domain-containing protein [Bacteroidales bacterium]MCF8456757.1 rhodanese-like domain-containing protein [Bacteroidales bacterium]